MESIKAVIIDDEEHCRSTLSKQIEWFAPEINLIGEAESVSNGIKEIKDKNPELVFLDIEMTDGTGFDLLKHWSKPPFKFIFTTAFDEYALEAFKVHAIAYLLKPIDGEELSEAVKSITIEKQDVLGNKLESLMKYLSGKDQVQKVALPVLDGLQFVKIDDIIRAEASGNYSTVYMNNGTQHFISKTLKFIMEAIEHSKFIRVHQSHLINMDYVSRYIRGKNGQIILDDGSVIPVSRSKKEDFLDLF
ncbi:LytR/AlgR family response regulator transcription factor [Portibacter marinus]|uniref:LytR/AlgR family response regulator transcription factor n=1 Tax=Portibacter marinus TaxID=2898660 RepID=UPI001F42252E|nr:LytTR family DNA-binding domain-containing protein [Portibacter marinus]